MEENKNNNLKTDMEKNENILNSYSIPISILIAGLMISGSIMYKGDSTATQTAQIGNTDPETPKVVETSIQENDRILGDPDAKIEIVEYSDFQCPYCRLFWQNAYQDIKRDYIDTGKAYLVYRHLPLDIHPVANITAQASECAGEQNKFWQFHDIVFAKQAELGENTIDYGRTEIEQWASEIEINMDSFNKCLDEERYAKKIEQDIASANEYGLRGTPSLAINGQLIIGAQPYSVFKSVIEEKL